MAAADARDYTLGHRADILAILDRLHDEHVPTTIEFAGGHAILSTVLQVRRDTSALLFDVSRDADANRALFASTSLAFVTELDHVQIAFETQAAMPIRASDGPAAIVPFPTEILRLQRREWFRAALPVQPPIRCTVVGPRGDKRPAQAIDLSCGGVGLLATDLDMADASPGTDHAVTLSLPEVGPLALDATLRTVRLAGATSSDDDAPAMVRLGFRFERMPAKTANQIQRYVQHLEVNQLRVLRLRSRQG